jgi:hypothetical protein
MKIDNYPTDAVYLRPQTGSVTDGTKRKGREDFAALLDQAPKDAKGGQEGLAAISELNGSSALLAQSSLAQLQVARLKATEAAAAPAITTEEAVRQVEDTLSLLEDYAIALGDPATSLKDLAPLAEELSLGAASLNSLSKGLKEDDPLKGISSETAALAGVEALKFKRGDFV